MQKFRGQGAQNNIFPSENIQYPYLFLSTVQIDLFSGRYSQPCGDERREESSRCSSKTGQFSCPGIGLDLITVIKFGSLPYNQGRFSETKLVNGNLC
jgi:hypothetical protein